MAKVESRDTPGCTHFLVLPSCYPGTCLLHVCWDISCLYHNGNHVTTNSSVSAWSNVVNANEQHLCLCCAAAAMGMRSLCFAMGDRHAALTPGTQVAHQQNAPQTTTGTQHKHKQERGQGLHLHAHGASTAHTGNGSLAGEGAPGKLGGHVVQERNVDATSRLWRSYMVVPRAHASACAGCLSHNLCGAGCLLFFGRIFRNPACQ
jgi:hypothetical protein